MIAVQCRDAQAQLRLRRVALADGHAWAGRKDGRGREPGQLAVARPERRADKVDGVRMGQVAGHGHDRVGGPVRAAPEGADGLRREGPDAGLVAADLATEGAVTEERGLEQDLAVLGRVVEIRTDLLDDDRPLVLDLPRRQRRAHDQLTQDVDRPSRFPARDADPVDGRFAIGRRVERATNALDGLADGTGRGIGRRPLERQVLHEMRDPGLGGGLEARSGQDVRGDGD